MKKSLVSLLAFSSIVAISCKTYLTPAVLGHNIGYVPKPMVSDDQHVKTYVTAGFGGSATPSDAINFELGTLNVNRSHTLEYLNFSYGVFGYFGTATYENQTKNQNINSPILPNFSKGVSGLGIRTSIGFHDTSDNGNTDYRLLSWDNSLSTEMGAYADYRDGLSSGIYDLTYISRMKTIWTTGISTEIIFHSRKNKEIQHAFRFFIGGSPGLRKSFDQNVKAALQTDFTTANMRSMTATSYSYYLKYKKFSLTYEAATNLKYASNVSFGYIF